MRLVEVTKVNIIIDEVLVNVPMVEVIMVKGGIKKSVFLLSVKREGGSQPIKKNPHQKLLRFFLSKGGGGLIQSKRVLSEKLRFFGIIYQKRGVL